MSVMQVPRTTAPGLTLGAALSNSTRERPRASLPVTTRRIGFTLSGMGFLLVRGFVDIASAGDKKEKNDVRIGAQVGRDACCDLRRILLPAARSRAGADLSQPAGAHHRRSEPRRFLAHHRRASAGS